MSAILAEVKTLSEGDGVTLGGLLEVTRARGMGMVLILLALPSALPVPAAGYSTPFGLLAIFIGLQMVVGREVAWLPRRAREKRLSPRVVARMADGGIRFFSRLEFLIQPRWSWVYGRLGVQLLAVLVVLMGALMALPIPLTNTLPAGVIFLVGVAMLEKDGLFGLLAGLVGLLAMLVYVVVLYIALHLFQEYGWAGLQELGAAVRNWWAEFRQ